MNKIQPNTTGRQAVVNLCEGNPGALNVLLGVFETQGENGIVTLAYLDEMKIYGWKIWVCWKDFCKGDFKKFIELAKSRELKTMMNEYEAAHPAATRS